MRRNELLLVVVPYRDRSAHLASFMARVWRPLRREHANSRLIVAEQSVDGRRFNRGALLNAALHWYREHSGRRHAFTGSQPSSTRLAASSPPKIDV